MDRLDVTYTRFISIGKQEAVVETLLPLGSIEGAEKVDASESSGRGESMYEFLPSAESILEEVVPTSFKVKLFKCFLDAAVSEQIARMVAMKAATENAGEMIDRLKNLSNAERDGECSHRRRDTKLACIPRIGRLPNPAPFTAPSSTRLKSESTGIAGVRKMLDLAGVMA